MEEQRRDEARELKRCIRFWETIISSNQYLMSPGTQTLIEITIKHLKARLAALNGKQERISTE